MNETVHRWLAKQTPATREQFEERAAIMMTASYPKANAANG